MRVCRCGAGQEASEGKCDTPGFPLQDVPSIVREHQRCQKLRMPRNHARLNQTSTSMLQSWRANCDIQILIYDSSPDHIDLREISKVTDYVVAYSCKGNATFREEIETNKRIILGMDEVTGDRSELQGVCKRVLNRAASSRLISKQEASVLLANLELTVCSENIEVVSISNSTRLTIDGNMSKRSNILKEYANRSSRYDDMSLHDYFPIYRAMKGDCETTKLTVPHYTGLAGNPTFPVTEAYARHVLTVYKPWREYPNEKEWKRDFDAFINNRQKCPKSCRLHYDRVMQRYYDGTKYVEPTTTTLDYSHNEISEEDREALYLSGLGAGTDDIGPLELQHIERGLEYKWDKPPKVCARLQQI